MNKEKLDIEKACQILMDIQSDWECGEEHEAFGLAIKMLEKQHPIEEFLEMNNLEYHGLNNLEKFINGNFTRTKKGNIKYPIELPGSVMKEGKEGIPLSKDDYKIIPLILFVKEKESVVNE